MEVESALE
jgi:IS30 family transposase